MSKQQSYGYVFLTGAYQERTEMTPEAIQALMQENPNRGRRKPHTLGGTARRYPRLGNGSRSMPKAIEATLTAAQKRALRAARIADGAVSRITRDRDLMANMGTIHAANDI